MNTALFVKELRERKLIALFGVTLAFMPLALTLAARLTGNLERTFLANFSLAVTLICLMALVFIFPVLIGASAIAGELEKRTLSFLLSLPVSRLRLWLVKVAACAAMLYGLLALFLVVNLPEIFRFIAANVPPSKMHTLALLAVLPLYYLSIVFFTSALFDRESLAATSFILVLIAAEFLLGALRNAADWSMAGIDNAFACLVLTSFFLSASASMFRNGELAGARGKRLPALAKVSLAWLVPGAVAMLFLYQAFGVFRLDRVLSLAPVRAHGGSVAVLADAGASELSLRVHFGTTSKLEVESDTGYYDLCALSLSDGKLLGRLANRVESLAFSPAGDRIAMVRVFTRDMPHFRELWLMDADGKNKKRVKKFDEITSREPHTLAWDGDRVVFASSRLRKNLDRMATTLVFADRDGNVAMDVTLPHGKDSVPAQLSTQVVNGRVYFIEGSYFNVIQRPVAGRVRVSRFNERTGSAETVFEKSAPAGGSEVLIGSMKDLGDPAVVSPDEKRLLYLRRDPRRGLSIVAVNLETCEERVLASGTSDFVARWCDGGKSAALATTDGSRARFAIFDAATGRELLAVPGAEMPRLGPVFSPDGARFAYVTEDDGGRHRLKVFDRTRAAAVMDLPLHEKAWHLLWADDGSLVVSNAGSMQRVDPGSAVTTLFRKK